jgi:hypothetical protein
MLTVRPKRWGMDEGDDISCLALEALLNQAIQQFGAGK